MRAADPAIPIMPDVESVADVDLYEEEADPEFVELQGFDLGPEMADAARAYGARASYNSLGVADADRRQAVAHCEMQRKVAAAAAAQLVERGTRATALQDL